jgi:drug/metabolite transporter (DMT)-like permease
MSGEGRRFLLMAVLAVWAVLWGLSVYALATLPAEGEPPRMTAFLGLQLAAALPAFAAWAIGRAWPEGSSVRAVSCVPLRLALGLGAVVGGLMLWAGLMSGA